MTTANDTISKTRLEAFSDGVIAIILTIMVLELKVPKEAGLSALVGLWEVYFAYALSFAIVFSLWLTHHHIFDGLPGVNATVLSVNGVVLFAMSLIPFATAYAAEFHWREPLPSILYGLIMVAVSLCVVWLRRVIIGLAPDTRAEHAPQIRAGFAMAGVFLLSAAVSWYSTRLALLAYALVPLIRFFSAPQYRSFEHAGSDQSKVCR